MTKKLTLEDRYYISLYSRRLTCTIALRYKIDEFFNQIEITPEEMKTYGVRIDDKTMEFKCNDNTYTVEYEKFSDEVIASMKEFISMFDHEKHKTNEMLQRAFKYFRKIM